MLRFRRQHQSMKHAKSFEEWSQSAKQLDVLEGREAWKKIPSSSFYNAKAITGVTGEMRKLMYEKKGVRKLVDLLLERVFTKNRVSYGIHNEELFSQTHFGTKAVVEEFINEVLISVETIFQDEDVLSLEEKLSFFDKAISGYGRSALCLSGGGTIGYFHFGVIKALLEVGMLPEIVSGTSAGSLIAAMVGCRTDEELRLFLVPELHELCRPFEKGRWHQLNTFWSRGCIFENDHFYQLTRRVVFGDMTFKEAYLKTGRILNITVTNKHKHGGQILLNYMTVPDVTLWSAGKSSVWSPRSV
jgi:hypothetical protein